MYWLYVLVVYVAVEIRNSTLCCNTSFENDVCKVFVSIRLFAFSAVVFDYLQRIVQSKGCLLVLFLDHDMLAQRCDISYMVCQM